MEQQPGTTITPQNQQPAAQIPPAADKVAADAPTAVPAPGWQFRPDGQAVSPDSTVTDQSNAGTDSGPIESLSWTSSEFIAHEKSAGWYALLGVGAVLLAAVVYGLTRDKISATVVIVAAILLGVFAARKPRTLEYKVDGSGVTIGPKFYEYDLFKSFSLVTEGAIPGITLLPLKRFMPQLTLYYEPKDEEQIVDVLADRLPLEDRQADMVDRFMHRIRF